MPNLNLIERLMLEGALSDPTETLYPYSPAFLAAAAMQAAVARMIATGLAEEREIEDRMLSYRSEGARNYAIYATEAGLAAVRDNQLIEEPAL